MDIALIPWAVRYYVLPLYKGPEFAIPTDDPSLAGYHEWLAAVQALPAVVDTVPDEAEYVAHIKKYADGVAQSKVRWSPTRAPLPASLPHTRAWPRLRCSDLPLPAGAVSVCRSPMLCVPGVRRINTPRSQQIDEPRG